MKKLIISLICGAVALGVAGVSSAPASALSLAPCPDDENKAACEARQAEIIRRWDKGESLDTILRDLETTKNEDAKTEIAPTFAVDLEQDQRVVDFTAGHSRFLMGNNLTSNLENRTGLSFFFGNNLSLRPVTEYGVLFGNTINFSGETVRDLYIVGNTVTLSSEAKIGRDVFAAANILTVDTDVAGNLAVTSDTLTLQDVKISGNLELEVAHLKIVGQVEVAGAFVYNDDADISGLERIKAANTSPYHLDEPDATAILIARVYSQIMSIVALFLAMVIICALFPRLHDKLAAETTVGRFGTNLAIGLGLLIAVPIIALFAFFTLVAAPLGIIAIALYLIAIYLAQGFTGAWLGHVIVEKLCKAKGNIFVEALIGIVIMGLLSLVPYLGAITGFLGLLLGLGLIFSSIKPAKKTAKIKEAKQVKA